MSRPRSGGAVLMCVERARNYLNEWRGVEWRMAVACELIGTLRT
jgi:hypothetical protein